MPKKSPDTKTKLQQLAARLEELPPDVKHRLACQAAAAHRHLPPYPDRTGQGGPIASSGGYD